MKTLHSSAVRPSKAKAFRILEDSFYTGEQLTDKQLSELLLYFAPAKKKSPKTPLDFVRLAVPTNDVRHYLNYINVLNGIASGCDGHRLYQAPVDLEDGAYCPKTLAPVDPNIAGRYPDVDRIKPEKLNASTAIILSNADVQRVPHIKGVTLINGWPFNTEYIQPVIEAMDKFTDVHLIPRGNNATLVFKSDSGAYGMVMGIKKK